MMAFSGPSIHRCLCFGVGDGLYGTWYACPPDLCQADKLLVENERLREALRDAEAAIFEGVREDAPTVCGASWQEICEDADEVRATILDLLGVDVVSREFPRLTRLEHIQAENERLRKSAEDGNVEIERLRHEIDDYRQAEERLREALAFYANESSYLWHWDEGTGTQTRGAIQGTDRGATARAALGGVAVTAADRICPDCGIPEVWCRRVSSEKSHCWRWDYERFDDMATETERLRALFSAVARMIREHDRDGLRRLSASTRAVRAQVAAESAREAI